MQGLPDIPCTPDGTRRPSGIFGEADPDLQTFFAALEAAAAEKRGAFHLHLFERLTAYGEVPKSVRDFRGDKTQLRGGSTTVVYLDDAADFSPSIKLRSTAGTPSTEIVSPVEGVLDVLDVLDGLFD